MGMIAREKIRAGAVATGATIVLAGLVVVGSRNLEHFDAALVGYTFATLFAAFGITYRYAMWLQRPPTRLYWRRGWQLFLKPGFIFRNVRELGKRFFIEFMLQPFHPPKRQGTLGRALADHVGVHHRGVDHVSAGVGMDSL